MSHPPRSLTPTETDAMNEIGIPRDPTAAEGRTREDVEREIILNVFLARSTDTPFEDTDLARVLVGLPSLGLEGPWLAGGALRRTLQGNKPDSDFDFFFRDKEQLETFAAALEDRGFRKVRETEHHLHFRGKVDDSDVIRDVQLIRFAFYVNARAVIDSFDFTVCQFAFDGVRLFCGEYSLWDLGRKRLAIHKVTFPVSTMRRLLKYTRQGFTACKGCLASVLRSTIEKPELQTQLEIEYVD